jgi:putative PEP-CTERM system histidine kinase
MENSIFFSYLTGTIAYSSLFLFSILRKNRHWLFLLAILLSALWCASVMHASENHHYFMADTLIYETARNAAWFLLLGSLLSKQHYGDGFQFAQARLGILPILFIISVASIEVYPNFLETIQRVTHSDPRFLAHLVFAVFGLILTEQLYRNTPLLERWHLKFLCLGVGAMFAVDLITYSKSLLYRHMDMSLWQSRGLINALIASLLAFTVPRLESTQKHAPYSIPRNTIFYTTVLFGSGIYLTLMSVAGYFLKETNAEWGESLQITFIFLAVLLLLVSFTSGKIRALAKIYFGKHFFHYSYDYREEWIKISEALAKLGSLDDLKNFIITTLTNLVESSGGGLWLKNDQGHYFLAAEQNLRLTPQELDYLKQSSELPQYLTQKEWVIDFYELARTPEVYDDIDLTAWCQEASEAWLIVPLFHLNHLEAFAVLTQPRVPRKLNWEDHDLLKTVGLQLANALALSRASEALAYNKQFETFNRLSAYLVHDLKNIAAQLSLIVKNAGKHRHNPEFFDDTIDTINHAVSKMQHIVEQLKHGKATGSAVVLTNLVEVLTRLQRQHKGWPEIRFETDLAECQVRIDQNKFYNIMTNLLQNAQDATQQSGGKVKLVLTSSADYAVIQIIDNGVGMDSAFIAERLFKPFDTTKGNAGMGIGAYEARDFVLKSAGHIDVESQVGHGTTFTLKLPLSPIAHDNV